jgi:glycogen operon protein
LRETRCAVHRRATTTPIARTTKTSWFDWILVETNRDLYRFWKRMIEFRKRHRALHPGRFFTGTKNERAVPESCLAWAEAQQARMGRSGWARPGRDSGGFHGDEDIHIMLNMYWESLDFELPSVRDRIWLEAVDTSKRPPL